MEAAGLTSQLGAREAEAAEMEGDITTAVRDVRDALHRETQALAAAEEERAVPSPLPSPSPPMLPRLPLPAHQHCCARSNTDLEQLPFALIDGRVTGALHYGMKLPSCSGTHQPIRMYTALACITTCHVPTHACIHRYICTYIHASIQQDIDSCLIRCLDELTACISL